MHKLQRQQLILDQVTDSGFVTLNSLREQTAASLPTLRRDVNQLAELGKVLRCHGGVKELPDREPGKLAGAKFEFSNTVKLLEKQAIAAYAASLVDDGDSIIINGGSTTFQMVHYLKTTRLDVLTNSLFVANYMFEHSLSRLHVPGGEIYRDQHLILSPFEDGTIRNFHASKMFVGAQAVRKSGALEVDPRLIQSERKLMRQAEQLILCVDSSKFDQPGSLILAELDAFDLIITDDRLSTEAQAWLKDSGASMKIVVVGSALAV